MRFPLAKLFVVEGSRRSAHSNAYLFGFWKNKRVVLYDTLIAGFDFAREAAAAGLAGKSAKKTDAAADSASPAPEKEKEKATETASPSSGATASDTIAAQNPRLDTGGANSSESEANAKKDEGASAKASAKGCDTDEILAVLGHEFGHWKYSHFLILFTFSQVLLTFDANTAHVLIIIRNETCLLN